VKEEDPSNVYIFDDTGYENMMVSKEATAVMWCLKTHKNCKT